MVPASCVFLFNEKRQILVIKRVDEGFACVPVSGINPGEGAEERARREVLEETGLTFGKNNPFLGFVREDCRLFIPTATKVT